MAAASSAVPSPIPWQGGALFPYISTDGLKGAAFIPTDGHVVPGGLCLSIAAGARLHGTDIKKDVVVTIFTAKGNLPITGGETILHRGRVMSLATSVGFGATIDRTIVHGYLDRALWKTQDFTLEVFGEAHALSRAEARLYDPANIRLKM